ncbi:YihY/virulence factor BrkB family protein [Rhodococcus fascians]|uniref:YihY/virulence factor BrkB family protein n=1 Tax=Rhodococcoides fascians TaxID=1828 RepID=UPI0024B71CA8|nr:YihY/virulence factor BrkB family protein [Rhodococcus fascians]MDJ0004034.1 YihY/virulence factor BrkB family protein [Rhodococcus fascians]
MTSIRVRAVRGVQAIKAGFAREDTTLIAGGLTFYAVIAVVPLLLLTIRATVLLVSAQWVQGGFDAMSALLPDALGARAALDGLADAGIHLGPLGVVISIFPATFYGEGLRRAIVRFAPTRETFTGWRGRAAMVPFFVAAPVLLIGVLTVARVLDATTSGGGAGALALRIFLGFNCLWLILAVPLAWTYRVIAPRAVGWRALVAGSLVTSSIVTGFVHGFILFLAIPVDLGAPFGGLTDIGGGVAIMLWMFVFHVLALAGWLITAEFDRPVGTARTSAG